MSKNIWPSDSILRRCNWCLYIVIVCASLYSVLLPLLPQARFTISNLTVGTPTKTINPDDIDRGENQLSIPSIRLEQPILEGTDPNTVNRGVWRVPDTSTPPKESNTVLVGHRFSYKNPSVFYLLDKIEQGDSIYVTYDAKIYVYSVEQIRTVLPNEISVEAASDNPRLTIYTCTPLWSASHRLVIESKLKEVL